MSDIRFEGWLHRSGTGGVYQDSAGNVGIASTQPKTSLDIQNGAFQVGPAGICTVTSVNVGTAATIHANGNVTCGIITTTNIVNSTQLSHRNIIVNGDMRVAQRGTSFTNISDTGVIGSVDRMVMVGANLDEFAFAGKQTSDGPDGFTKCFEVDVTTAENALDANDLAYIRYKIEGQDLVPLFNDDGTGKDFTLSFYVKAYQAGTYQLNIYKSTGPRFISKTYTVDASATWQRIEIPFTGDTNTSGMNDNTSVGFQIAWMLVAGTDYTSGSLQNWGGWPGNSGFAAGHAVNVASSADNYFRITGIQLEAGSVATPFEHLSFQENYLRCARYYLQMTRLPVMSNRLAGYVSCTSRINPVPMRAVPSLSIAGTITFNSFFYGGGQPTSTTAPGLQNNGDAGAPYGSDYFIVNFSGFSSSNFQTNEFGEVFGTTIKLDSEL